MKKFTLFAVLVLACFSFTETIAQVVNAEKIDSVEKATINNSEKVTKEITHDGIKYYVVDGMWHTKLKNRLVFRQPPKGLKIDFLPKDGKSVVMGGKKYYKCKGIFYRKIKKNLYEVARP